MKVLVNEKDLYRLCFKLFIKNKGNTLDLEIVRNMVIQYMKELRYFSLCGYLFFQNEDLSYSVEMQ